MQPDLFESDGGSPVTPVKRDDVGGSLIRHRNAPTSSGHRLTTWLVLGLISSYS